METKDKEVDTEDSEFYFESDHLALKGNKDYMSLLKSIVILEAQRAQAIKELDELLECRGQALKDPIGFVEQLKSGNLPTLPGPKKVVDVPHIDWSRYNIIGPDARARPQTRHGNFMSRLQPKNEQDDGKILVRGRAYDETKPETFNQLWTVEEQRRLEELLKEFPSEEVEMRRWTKIANALGNRTPKQVSSRIQKYFQKLNKAGLPTPGRGPKSKVEFKRSSHHRQRNNYFLLRKSTFFPHQDYTVDEKDHMKDQMTTEDSGDDGSMCIEDNPELRQIELLRRVKTEKEEGQEAMYQNFGYKCTVCGEDPLRGTRWNCTECRDVNLCGDCAVSQMEAVNPAHPPSHKLHPIGPPESLRNYDSEYFPQSFDNASCNYEDRNFSTE